MMRYRPKKRLTSTWEWCKYRGDPSACENLDDETSFRFHMVKVYHKRSMDVSSGPKRDVLVWVPNL